MDQHFSLPSDEPFEALGLVERVERLASQLPAGDPLRTQLLDLRAELAEREDIMDDARATIEKLEAVVQKVTSPANRIGTFITAYPRFEEGRPAMLAQIIVGGSEFYCNVDPRLDVRALRRGTRVLVNEAYVIVGDLGYDRAGPVVKVGEVLGPDRLRVGGEMGQQGLVLFRSELLSKEKLKAGDEVRCDANFRVALEMLQRPKQNDYYLDTVPELPWDKVGGQHEAITAIREAIEGPLLHPDLYEKFHHATPKGFLLYGPPGCGKTLIGKATAWNLTQQLRAKTGVEMKEFFMHIKGPEILNMWVGESERMVREIFATAREKRREGYLPFIFIDEAESILGTRRAGRFNSILSTLVPMFCTEMDGLESLHDAVIIIASNRADLIDPAILRPGRIDRKIKVHRPTKEGAREIYKIYLTPDLPYDSTLLAAHGSPQAVCDYLVDRIIDAQFTHRDENRFLSITLRSGRKETLYRGDLISGAIIASIVERAKAMAIKRALATEVAHRGTQSGSDVPPLGSTPPPPPTPSIPTIRDLSRAVSTAASHPPGLSAADLAAIRNPKSEIRNPPGLSEADLLASLEAEYHENDIFPPSDITEDWLHLIDHDAENVVKVNPIRPQPANRPSAGTSVV